ncbi:hypothetical protein QQ045_024503 [Rhodiola kirilowii]
MSLLFLKEPCLSKASLIPAMIMISLPQAPARRDVGIWYYKITPRTVVWVANRDFPLNDYTGVLAILNGNIQVLDGEGRKSYWSTEVMTSASARTAKLLNSGNLVLVNDASGEKLWESFKNPTDTFLPGMKMDENLALTSWKSRDDPSIGNYTFEKNQQDQYIIRKGSIPYWVSGKSGMYVSYNQIPIPIIWMLLNISDYKETGDDSQRYNVSVERRGYNVSAARLVMNVSGSIEFLDIGSFNQTLQSWSAPDPEDPCSVDNACGKFGSCNAKNGLLCRCLPGYIPSSPDDWYSGDFSGGCTPKSSLCGKNTTFLSLRMMKMKSLEAVDVRKGNNESDCKNECFQECKCLAYSYKEMEIRNRDRGTNYGPRCLIWQELSDLQEQYNDMNITLNVRVAVSILGPPSRNCKPCGTNLIPYPLSTGAECGDPTYSGFSSDDSTGQLSFQAKRDTFHVLSINTTTASFIIQVSDRKNCGARDNRLQLEKSSPFQVKNLCYTQPGIVSPSGYRDFAEIVWDRPLQPLCTQLSDCQDWQNSSCLPSRDGMKRCLCNENHPWDNVTISCTQVGVVVIDSPPLPGQHLRETSASFRSEYAIVIVVVIAIAIICIILFFIYKRIRRVARPQDAPRSQSIQLYDSETRAIRMIQSAQFSENDKKSIEVPFFELDTIIAATNNFSDENKLGRGGFGPVYKGIFSGNRHIAIKMLASVSEQGLDEFKNEIVLISRLQHRNSVQLVPSVLRMRLYCITREEKMLLYEYMPNKSLDYFIFDRALSMHLNWDIRFSIIMGIARGLLYLHEDSRLKIIHRDLKLSNILLDEDLNPKISDFGLARIFASKQTEAVTNKVVGTYGYMSPEYALEGFFSVKSDVFSLGVMVLEIISGRRNTGFYNSDHALSLLGLAWKLWTEHSAVELMATELRDCCKMDEYMKCVQIGLLCVQEDPNDRALQCQVWFIC